MGRIAQSVTCLTADSDVASLILARSQTLAKIDYKIISTTILLPSADSRRVLTVTGERVRTKYWLTA